MTKVIKKVSKATIAKATPARLGTIAECMANEHELRGKLIATVKAAGGNHDAVKKHVWAVRLALVLPQIKKLNVPMIEKIEKAKLVLAKVGYKAGAPTANMQTLEEHKAIGAARTYWSRLLSEAGLVTTETRGGANNKGKAKTPTATDTRVLEEPKAAPKAAPKVASPGFANATAFEMWLVSEAAMILATTNKNGAHASVKIVELVTAFQRDIRAAQK